MSYNPYTPSSWLYYVHYFFQRPKEKPNVGYWPKGRSTSKPFRKYPFESLMTLYFSDQALEAERYRQLFLAEAEENFAYHRHQQHMTDEFRAKPHFANRILVQREVTLADYYEWNANFPEMRGNW